MTLHPLAMNERQNNLERQLAERDAELDRLRQEFQQMKEQASKDPLTNLANRFAFLEALQSAIAVAYSDTQDLCLMMIDIDHFKEVNDQHGHLIGDMALQSFGKILSGCINNNKKATAARFGGEEFTVLLPNTKLSEAIELANNLRRELLKSILPAKNESVDPIHLTVSVGVAQYRWSESATHLLDRADSELYLAKAEGRDRVRPSPVP